jgi:uncharacterized OB-fold protein
MDVGVPVRDGLFTDGDRPTLLGGRCQLCAAHHFPQHDTCPYCASAQVTAVELSSTGRLWAWTAVTAAPPGYRGDVPYGFGIVELPEGLRVVTRLSEADPARLREGQPMRLRVVHLYVDEDSRPVLTYAFSPDESA